MDDVTERVRRDLDDLAPLPAFDDVRRRAVHRARRRRMGAGVLGVAVAIAVIAGAWTVAVREGERPTQSTIPGATASTEQLFLAGDGEAWVVDPASGTSRHLSMPELPPGDAPYRVARRDGAIVAWAYQTLVLRPDAGFAFDVLVPDSLIFIPSSEPDRVWVGIVDESQDDARLTAVREVSVDGRVTVQDTRPPRGRWPVAAVDGNLVFQGDDELLVWDPSTGREVDRLPGELPVAWDGSLLAWCDGACRSLNMKDLDTGETLTIEPPAGTTGFEALRGAFSPDRRTLAVAVCLGHGADADRQLGLIDVRSGRITLVDGATVPTPYVFIDWAPSGESVFITGGQNAGPRQIVQYRIGDDTAHVLDVSVGDFYGVATFRSDP